jgi:hypothetical protein
MVDEIKKVIEEYMNWLYPQPVEVLDIKDFRDYSPSFVLGNRSSTFVGKIWISLRRFWLLLF